MNLVKRHHAAELTMFLSRMFTGLLVLAFASACGPNVFDLGQAEQKLIQKAMTDIPSVKEFHKICPATPVRLFWKSDSVTIQVTDVVYDRYEMSLTVEVKTDPKKTTITSYGAPLIKLLEVTLVEDYRGGALRMSYGSDLTISQDQWRRIVEAGGQFSAGGIEVKTNEPVAGIEEYKARLRKPPIQ